MDTLSQLAHGFAVAFTRSEPVVVPARHHARHSDRRAAGPWTGADHRAASADHLPGRAGSIASSCSPASTTAPCMAARPPRSCSTRLAKARRSSPRWRATRWPVPAAAAQRLRLRRSAPSSPARSARSASPSSRRLSSSFALAFGPAEYFSLMVLAFVMVSAVLGSSAVRGLTSLFVGFFLGMIGIDLQTGQPRFTFGVTELLDGTSMIVAAVGLFAVGETLYVASRRYAGKRRDRAAQRLALHDRAGMGALLEGLDARRRHRLPDRRPAGGRRGNPDLPLLCAREEAVEAQGGIRHDRRDRGRRRTGGRQQRLGGRACWCRC